MKTFEKQQKMSKGLNCTHTKKYSVLKNNKKCWKMFTFPAKLVTPTLIDRLLLLIYQHSIQKVCNFVLQNYCNIATTLLRHYYDITATLLRHYYDITTTLLRHYYILLLDSIYFSRVSIRCPEPFN